MNPHLKFLFPQSLYIVENFMVSDLEIFEKRIQEIKNQFGTGKSKWLPAESSFNTYDKMFEDVIFSNFAEEVKLYAIDYLHELGLGYLSDVLDYNKMWYNVTYKGDYNIPHIHGNSVISGAYYIKTSTNNKITFFKDFQSMMPQSDPITELGKTFEEVDCIPGRLVLFRSDLMHGNAAQDDGEKIVISFNLGITKK